MLIGKFEHSLDEKGRISLPAPHRKHFTEDLLVLTCDLTMDKSLALFAKSVWEAEVTKLLSEDSSDPFVQKQMDWFVGNAREVSPNSAGRIQLAKEHREFLKVKEGDTLVLTGLGNRVVVRSKSYFDQNAPKAPPSREVSP